MRNWESTSGSWIREKCPKLSHSVSAHVRSAFRETEKSGNETVRMTPPSRVSFWLQTSQPKGIPMRQICLISHCGLTRESGKPERIGNELSSRDGARVEVNFHTLSTTRSAL